jgi:hypothetical protein
MDVGNLATDEEVRVHFARKWLDFVDLAKVKPQPHIVDMTLRLVEAYPTHFSMDNLGWLFKGVEKNHHERFRTALDAVITNSPHPAGEYTTADDGFMFSIISSLGRLGRLDSALTHPPFRVRARELRPDILPPFDPVANTSDLEELSHLAYNCLERQGVAVKCPDFLRPITPDALERFYANVRAAAGKINPPAADKVLAGVDGYHLVKDFQKIKKTLELVV